MGGTCSNGVRPYKFSLADLKDLRDGDTKQMDKGCGPSIEGTIPGSASDMLQIKGFGWPDNGEFEWGGLGDNCDLWDGEYGCECTSSGHIGGRRGKVKRKAFKADATECCLANVERQDANKIIGDYTCDPENRKPTSSGCTNVYSDYCKVGDRMLTDPKCSFLQNSNSTLYSQLMKETCNKDDYYMNSKCLDWCGSNSTDCSRLNVYKDCKKYEIPANECTPQKVVDIRAECTKYGITSEQGLAIYKCSPAGINALIDECKINNVFDTCSPTSIQDAIDNATRASQLEIQAKTTQQIQENYDKTQQTIAGILNLTDQPTPTPEAQQFDIETITKFLKDNSTIVIILVIILILLSSSSSVSLLLLKM